MKSRVKEKNKMISRGMKVQVKAASATESYMVGTKPSFRMTEQRGTLGTEPALPSQSEITRDLPQMLKAERTLLGSLLLSRRRSGEV